MKYPFEDKTVLKHNPENKDQNYAELIMQHDVKIQELSIRLDHIENNINRIMNNKICWDVIEDDKTKA